MLASLCVETINKLFHDRKQHSIDDEQLFKMWHQIYHYFQSADSSTIQRIVESYRWKYYGYEPFSMIPLHIQRGVLKLIDIKTMQTIKFLESIKKKDVNIIAEVHCSYYLEYSSISMFSNLKRLTLTDIRGDDMLRCVSQECPLLENFTWRGAGTDIGLEYLGDLTKLVYLTAKSLRLTVAGIVSFLKKSRNVLEFFEYHPLEDLFEAVDILASQNEVLPNMKYFQCKFSKLATALIVFPCIKSLILKISGESIEDFIKLKHIIKNNKTMKHLYIDRHPGGPDAYELLRSLSIIFPQITRLTFHFREDYEIFSYLDAEVDSSFSASTMCFRSVTRLCFMTGFSTSILQASMYPGNNIKYLEIWDVQLFRRVEFISYLSHLTEVVEIYLKHYYLHDCSSKLIDRIVMLLPSIQVFRIDYIRIAPKALKNLKFTCSSNNRYGIQFFVNDYCL